VNATKVSKAYTGNIVSFQSTGPTNISGVNNLPSLQLYVTKRVRGRGGEKRVWAIEQNEARETYLNHYFGMDVADHPIAEMIKLSSGVRLCVRNSYREILPSGTFFSREK
jgi:regulatory protein YycI of two-component signal transduction system YycFG